MTDFNQLLDMPANQAEPPKPLPVGTYRLRIGGVPKQITSRDKGTPGYQFTFSYIEAGEDVDADLLQEANERKDLTQRSINYTFWITEDAMFMFKDFIEKLGLDASRSFRENIADMPGSEIWASVVQQPSQRGNTVFNQIESFASVDAS